MKVVRAGSNVTLPNSQATGNLCMTVSVDGRNASASGTVEVHQYACPTVDRLSTETPIATNSASWSISGNNGADTSDCVVVDFDANATDACDVIVVWFKIGAQATAATNMQVNYSISQADEGWLIN